MIAVSSLLNIVAAGAEFSAPSRDLRTVPPPGQQKFRLRAQPSAVPTRCSSSSLLGGLDPQPLRPCRSISSRSACRCSGSIHGFVRPEGTRFDSPLDDRNSSTASIRTGLSIQNPNRHSTHQHCPQNRTSAGFDPHRTQFPWTGSSLTRPPRCVGWKLRRAPALSEPESCLRTVYG